MAKSKKSRALTTATGLSTLANVYYSKAMVENLKAPTPFMRSWRGCACGKPGIHEVQIRKNDKRFKRRWERKTVYLCDGCNFRYRVMKAAGRLPEFLEDYEKQENEILDICCRPKPLPVTSGKTIQMYDYKLVTKP